MPRTIVSVGTSTQDVFVRSARGFVRVRMRMLEDLRADGIDVPHVLVEPGCPRRTRLSSSNPAVLVEPGLPSISLVLLAAAIDAAKASGARVLLNPAGGALERLRTVLPLIHRCDVLAVNREEGRLILGAREQNAVELARGLARL